MTVLVETQLTLTGADITIVDGKQLTDRQQHAWDTIRLREGGCTSDEIGAQMHELRGRHLASSRCGYCAQEGRGVLTSVALRPLVMRKRNGQWVPRTADDQEPAASSQQADLPADDDGTWEALFR